MLAGLQVDAAGGGGRDAGSAGQDEVRLVQLGEVALGGVGLAAALDGVELLLQGFGHLGLVHAAALGLGGDCRVGQALVLATRGFQALKLENLLQFRYLLTQVGRALRADSMLKP